MSGKENLFWNYSVIGFFVWAAIMLVLSPFLITGAVMRSKLEPGLKLLCIAALWGALILVGVPTRPPWPDRSAPKARA